MKLLIAEDDAHIRQGLVDLLQMEGYSTCAAIDGKQALEFWQQDKPDMLLLDIMMPGLSGYDVCREVRRQDQQVPIIFISAKSEEVDRVLGLELGADDYIQKPFGVREVVARIRAVTRRLQTQQPAADDNTWLMADLQVDAAQLRARRGDTNIDLSLRDIRLLRMLFQCRDRVVSKDELYDCGWGRRYLPSSRTLDQHISQLRKRIELNPAEPKIVRTVHGVGYRYECDSELSC